MLVGENDLELLERTKEGRNINRHYYTVEEVDENFKRPVVEKLRDLMCFRNSCPAFDGECICETNGDRLVIERNNGKVKAILEANLTTYQFTIKVEE